MENQDPYAFYRSIGSPVHVIAPMVDQSELPWRLLCRKLGADLCYTPMIHSKMLLDTHNAANSQNEENLRKENGEVSGRPKMRKQVQLAYRDEFFVCLEADRPLIAQLCGNSADIVSQAAQLIVSNVDVQGIDLNLGCPQGIAKKGNYGAFLQDDQANIAEIIQTLARDLSVPVTAKIRVLENTENTVEYAKMLEHSGAQIVTVHGRLREQKGCQTGCADWTKIKAVKEALSVPVFANGNILYHSDIAECRKQTGCDAVMIAVSNLFNAALYAPAKFSADCDRIPYIRANLLKNNAFHENLIPRKYPLLIEHPPAHMLAQEYLKICRDLLESNSNNEQPRRMLFLTSMKAHMFKMLHFVLERFVSHQLRERITIIRTLDDFDKFLNLIAELVETDIISRMEAGDFHEWEGLVKPITSPVSEFGEAVLGEHYRILPYWVAKPHIHTDIKSEKSEPIPGEANNSTETDVIPVHELKRAARKASKQAAREKRRMLEQVDAGDSSKKVKRKLCVTCDSHPSPSCPHGKCKACCRKAVEECVKSEAGIDITECFFADLKADAADKIKNVWCDMHACCLWKIDISQF